MKEKESVDVIIREFELNPKCRHGPTILFSRKNGKMFFACSSDRSVSCFHLEYDQFEKNKQEILGAETAYARETMEDLRQLQEDERIFCGTCGEFIKSIQSHEFHSYRRLDDDRFLQQPSLFLPQLDNDKMNAQYFFDTQSLEFFTKIITDLGITRAVCIGAPRLHDHLRCRQGMKSILLDIDQRFEAFYPEEFFHYNMLNDFFLNQSQDEASRFTEFLKDGAESESAATRHCLFTDPPFGARTELLSQTLRSISHKYFQLFRKRLPIFWVFPYFNEHHVLKSMPEMEMMDFQVTYANHYAYNGNYKGRKEGSPIRVYTNVDQRIITYPAPLTDYRFCKACSRFVAQNNQHCRICKACPSKNGAAYRHCNSCIKCVKPNYTHCEECDRCVQKAGHECAIFQRHQECWFCRERGHVEKFCKLTKGLERPKRNGVCRVCEGNQRHNLMKCPSKDSILKCYDKL